MGKQKKYKRKYKDLEELFDEMSSYLTNLVEDHNRATEELRYLEEFIRYKNLSEEFLYFKENTHEEYEDDLPFAKLTL